MARMIKRYENRKLYDTAEKRYISLDDIAALVRAGEEVEVVDNVSGDDLTAQTLAKVILESGSRPKLPPQFLHDVLRFGNRFVTGSAEQVNAGIDRVVEASLQRLGPVRETRQELARVRERLAKLERLIDELSAEEAHGDETGSTGGPAGKGGSQPENG